MTSCVQAVGGFVGILYTAMALSYGFREFDMSGGAKAVMVVVATIEAICLFASAAVAKRQPRAGLALAAIGGFSLPALIILAETIYPG